MALKDFIDGWEEMSPRDLCQTAGMSNSLSPNLGAIIEWYDRRLNFAEILNEYTGTDLDKSMDQSKCRCILLEHGGEDRHESAMYYSFDRETGERGKESFYCHKCCKRMTAFTFLLRVERERRDRGFFDVVDLVKERYRVDFPRQIVADFDPETYFSWEVSNERQKTILENLARADSIRQLREMDPREFLAQAREFISSL